MTASLNSNSNSVSTLVAHRDLLWAWIKRTVLARYQQSFLGGAWAVFQPLATVLVFTVIFTVFLRIETEVPYPIFAFTAVVPWVFFASSIADAVASLVANLGLVTKIYFPREILPLAAVTARLVDFAISLVVLIILMLVYRMPVFHLSWLLIPVIVLVQMAFILGIGFLGSALNVFYRDISHLFVLILQLWFYITPIIYPVDRIPEEYVFYYFLNPMASIVESYRNVILAGTLPNEYFLQATVVSFITLIIGYWFFKRVEFQFSDVV